MLKDKRFEKCRGISEGMKMKKVSLILTTYNTGENLKKTLVSIEKQNYPNIEVIIKDGCSVDQTLDIIKKYQEKSSKTVIWESKKDSGIYDAMNQGYQMSSGDDIAFFNDVFVSEDVISKLIATLEEINKDTRKEYIGVHADLEYVDGDRIVRKWKMGEGNIRQG